MSVAPEHAKVVIVGAGFSGLGLAIRLKEQGSRDFVVLERAEDVGGTWTANIYPGLTCDIPSHLYSFSFAPNPNWSQTYSPQPEIRDYLRRCADQFGVRPHLRTNVAVSAANWLEDEQLWELDTSTGTYTADVLVSAMGPLTEPMMPDVSGLASFEGKVMYSARWDYGYDLKGKRVASIGTGASAIQYVPEIAGAVEELHVFQRTAPWIMPHGNRAITDFERVLYRRFPFAQKLVRAGVYASRELLVLGFAKEPRTGLGHGSMVYMIESQIEHVRSAIRTIEGSGAATIEVRPEAHEAFNRDVDAHMQGTVWDLGGCSASTSTGPVATPRCGPTGPGGSGDSPPARS